MGILIFWNSGYTWRDEGERLDQSSGVAGLPGLRFQRSAIRAACVDMWEPFRQSIQQWAPQCKIVYDKFHIMQHANQAVDEVRRAEFFRKGGAAREVVKGKRWLSLSRWVHLNTHKKRSCRCACSGAEPGLSRLAGDAEVFYFLDTTRKSATRTNPR
jgi:hypothetical protein